MKLIQRPSMCAARTKDPTDLIKNYCTIDGSVFLPCPSMFKFPKDCPLKNGIPIPKTVEEFIQVAKKEGLLKDVYPWNKETHEKYSHKCKKCNLIFRDSTVYASMKDILCDNCKDKKKLLKKFATAEEIASSKPLFEKGNE